VTFEHRVTPGDGSNIVDLTARCGVTVAGQEASTFRNWVPDRPINVLDQNQTVVATGTVPAGVSEAYSLDLTAFTCSWRMHRFEVPATSTELTFEVDDHAIATLLVDPTQDQAGVTVRLDAA